MTDEDNAAARIPGADVLYAELDQPVRELCRAINAFPGLRTTGSCGGHLNPASYQEPQGSWGITLNVLRDDHGWFALEFLAYIINNDYRRGGFAAMLYPYAAPPYLNRPGKTLYFAMHGQCNADTLAAYLTRRRLEDYIAPGASAPVEHR